MISPYREAQKVVFYYFLIENNKRSFTVNDENNESTTHLLINCEEIRHASCDKHTLCVLIAFLNSNRVVSHKSES